LGKWRQSGYTCQVEDVSFKAKPESMTTETESGAKPVHLTEDEVAYLLSILRSSTQVQPITTQELIDALRKRATQ
jgi:hypothetical protein